MGRTRTALLAAAFAATLGACATAFAQSHLAAGFTALPDGARVAVMPADIELFELSAGGVLEPRADWTAAAASYMVDGLQARESQLGAKVQHIADDGDETIVAFSRLHRAVSQAILLHHYGSLKLPTKEGKLDWTVGPDADEVRKRLGADYALFTFIRDSYASSARKATMVAAALFGIGIPLGVQAGYASLVDLKTGRIVWFNRLARSGGDLREREKAQETLDALLAGFPD